MNETMTVYENGFWVEKKKEQMIVPVLTRITPEMAEEFLSKNNRNRRLNRNSLTKLKNDIKMGRWKTNSNGIGFYSSGDLADGQTRLTAIKETGIPVTAVVVWNIDEDAVASIDVGQTRNANQLAKMACGDDVPKNAMQVVGFYLQMHNIRGKTSAYQKLDLLEATQEHVAFILEAYTESAGGRKIPSGIAVSYVQAALYAARCSGAVSDNDLLGFIKVLVSGISRSQKDIIVVKFRDQILANRKVSVGGVSRIEYFLRTQKALKNYIENNQKAYTKTSNMIWQVPKRLLPKIMK